MLLSQTRGTACAKELRGQDRLAVGGSWMGGRSGGIRDDASGKGRWKNDVAVGSGEREGRGAADVALAFVEDVDGQAIGGRTALAISAEKG